MPAQHKAGIFCIINLMESQNLKPIVNQKVAKAWRGYGFFISFDFGKTITKKGKNKVGEMIEIASPEISLSIEGTWAFMKDGKDVVAIDPAKEVLVLYEEIDKFLSEGFKPNQVAVENFEKQENVTIITFSNGFELEINNKREDREDGWYVLTEK
jgi:hypothetical protein